MKRLESYRMMKGKRLNIMNSYEKKGFEKGIEKEKVESARKMLLMGMETQLVQKITELSLEKIEELKRSLGRV